jgi:hypothetical protein
MSVTVSEPRHVYYVGPWRRWVLAWIFGPVLLGALVMGVLLPGEGRAIAGIMFVLILAVALAGQCLIDRSRLVISPAGVVLRQTGCTFESPWANVVEMRLDRGLEAFITREPAGGKGHDLFAASAATGALPYIDQRHLTLLDEHRLIPFEAFAWHLRNGEMRAQIESYAPHLREALAALDATGENAPKPARQTNPWKIVLVAALLGAFGWLALSPTTNRAVTDPAFATLVLGVGAIQSFQAARAYFKRRLWVWGAVLAVLGTAFALWALGMAVQLAESLRS